jgi:hypothetical protein
MHGSGITLRISTGPGVTSGIFRNDRCFFACPRSARGAAARALRLKGGDKTTEATGSATCRSWRGRC